MNPVSFQIVDGQVHPRPGWPGDQLAGCPLAGAGHAIEELAFVKPQKSNGIGKSNCKRSQMDMKIYEIKLAILKNCEFNFGKPNGPFLFAQTSC